MNPSTIKLIGSIGKGLCLFTLVVSLCLLSACATKGTAPVYTRGGTDALPKNYKRPSSYRIKSGDTLYSIAWRYRLDYRKLAAWNGIKGPYYRIYAGQWLRLHPPEKSRQAAQTNKKTSKRYSQVRKTPPKEPITSQPTASSSTATPKQAGAGNLKLTWRWPTNGKVVQTYSTNDPARKGLKISGVAGQSIVAAEGGKVVYSGSGLVGYGNLIIIKHNKNYLSAYGYNKRLLVKEGDKVLKGERIAQMGSPRNGTSPLLHFEIRKQGRPINPLSLLPKK